MPVYKGRRPNTHRVVIWAQGQSNEWVIEGTKKEALAFEARKRVDLGALGAQAHRRALTFSELCLEHYKPHAQLHLRDRTWRDRKYRIAHLIEVFGSIKLINLTAEHFETFKRVRLKQHVRASSINNELTILTTILNFARKRKFPVADLKIERLPEPKQRRVTAWTPAEIERMFTAAREHHPRLLPLLVFLVNTGCRPGEAIAAEWSWVDFDADMIRIPSNDVWRPKNGKPREIPMADAVHTILTTGEKHDRWLFPKQNGCRYGEFPKEPYWEIRNEAGLRGGPHQFRHTFASNFLQHPKADLFLLAKILGHSHTRVTELYTHLLPDHLERARNAVNILPGMMAVKRPRKRKRARNHGGHHG